MENYKSQVSLLLSVLPEVAKENNFALHGGTAINLFLREMPRLSVDIDLTYIPVEDRNTSLIHISETLSRIKSNIETVIPNVRITHKEKELKLLITNNQAQIKLEVSQAMRGVIAPVTETGLCNKAQTEFDAFCSIHVVPIGQLYGGKICAALDRQHPRDLFDVKYLLENEGFADEIKKGFLFCLLASKRPIYEMLFPNLLDQRSVMASQFDGMSNEPFTYDDFEATRNLLIQNIHKSLTAADKDFLLKFQNVTPDWSLYNFKEFPAVQWKLQNLQKLKGTNPEKHSKLINVLKDRL
jgi:predicted nucleotidyltransferase component of viral defense system